MDGNAVHFHTLQKDEHSDFCRYQPIFQFVDTVDGVTKRLRRITIFADKLKSN